MVPRETKSIFRQGSRTFSTSSLFFPAGVRRDVSILYAFVRTGDDYVDSIPQREEEFYRYQTDFKRCMNGESIDDRIIEDFAALSIRKKFDPAWIQAYFTSMEMDLYKSSYADIVETERFMHGSAEVIGLMMARIMELDEASFPFAALLGKALQYINFIRDIDEDLHLGRTYLPADEMAACGLETLDRAHVSGRPDRFREFIQIQLDRYATWQAEAERGYWYLPRRSLIPIKTASDMYAWTARMIARDPFAVYRSKIKPHKMRILVRMLRNMVRTGQPAHRSEKDLGDQT